MEHLTGHRRMRLFRTNIRYQRMVLVVPKGERNIGLVAQPGIGTVCRHQQTGRHHGAILQRHKGFIVAKRYLLQFRRSNQRDIAQALCPLPQRLMDHCIFNNMPKVGQALLLIVKNNAPETVAVPHFHAVIGAGACAEDGIPDAKVLQQSFAGGINRRNA